MGQSSVISFSALWLSDRGSWGVDPDHGHGQNSVGRHVMPGVGERGRVAREAHRYQRFALDFPAVAEAELAGRQAAEPRTVFLCWKDIEDRANCYKVACLVRGIRGVKLRSRARSRLRRCAAIVMIAAAMALAFETSFIPTSETATGENNHSHHDNASHSPHSGHPKTHVVTHVHADGTVHRHAVDGALDDHFRESGSPCWSMAIVVGVLPSLSVCTVEAILIGKLAIEGLDPYRSTEPDVPGRPPRPPSIAWPRAAMGRAT
jgi:hypothetical protein